MRGFKDFFFSGIPAIPEAIINTSSITTLGNILLALLLYEFTVHGRDVSVR